MKSTRFFAAAAMAACLPFAAQAAGNTSSQSPAPGSYKVAQVCGWYAIAACHRNWRAARNSANQFGGYVIDSSNPNYPNFRPGWYCAAVGPMPKWRAQQRVEGMWADGAGSAYIKSSC